MLALPYHLILEGFGPVIEFFSYISFFYLLFIQGAASLLFVTTFFMVAFVLGMVISFIAISLEQLTFKRYPKLSDMAQLFILSIIESFGYRQLNSYWRIHGVITFLLGRKDWGKMERKGFSKAK